MNMPMPLVVFFSGVLLLASASAQASIISGYGAVAEGRTFPDCAVLCLPPGGVGASSVSGGELATSATASIDNGDGTAFARATLTTGASLPALGARGASPGGGTTAGEGLATAIQAYTFTGLAPEPFSVLAALDGTVNAPAGTGDAVIEGRLAVYIWPDAEFPATEYATFINEIVPGSGGTVLDRFQLFITPSFVRDSDALDFTLNPGDEIYVYAQLSAKGERGGVADAASTLDLSFVSGNVDNLQPATGPSSVPAPQTILLLGPAVLMMAVSTRSRRGARGPGRSRGE